MNSDMQEGYKSTFSNFLEKQKKKTLTLQSLLMQHLTLQVYFLSNVSIFSHNTFTECRAQSIESNSKRTQHSKKGGLIPFLHITLRIENRIPSNGFRIFKDKNILD